MAYEMAKYYLPKYFISHFRATRFEQAHNQALYRVIMRLFSAYQVALPSVYIVEDNCAYCFSVATTRYRSYLFISKPMINVLNEPELYAVLSREAEKIGRDRSKAKCVAAVFLNRLMAPLRVGNKYLKSESLFHIFYGLTVLPWVRLFFKNNWLIQNQEALDASVLIRHPEISRDLQGAFLKIMKCNSSKDSRYSIDAIETLFPITLTLGRSTALGEYFEYDSFDSRLEIITNKFEKDI